MKTLIIYSSRYGLTAEAAAELANRLGEGTELFKADNVTLPKPDGYDRVIIGSPIYMGQADKTIRQWARDNQASLQTKDLGLFLCCGLPEQFSQYLEQAFGPDLVRQAVTACLGGELRTERMRWIDRRISGLMTRAARKEGKSLPQSDFGQIDAFAANLASAVHASP